MGFFTKEQIRELINERNIKTTQNINNMLKDMFVDVLQEPLKPNLKRNWTT